MRVECEACQRLVAASFAIAGGAVRARCPACGHAMIVPVASAAAGDAPEAGGDGSSAGDGPSVGDGARARAGEGCSVGDGHRASAGEGDGEGDGASSARANPGEKCPRCGAPRREAAACATCGLAASRMAAYADARDAGIPEPVREAWARAAAAWDEPARHDEVLRLVAAHGCYAWAAGQYRARGRDAVAARQLDRLRRAAEATLLASATVRPRPAARPYQATVGVLAILIVAIAIGLFYASVAREPSRAPGASTVPARRLPPGHPVSPRAILPAPQVR